MRESDTCSGSHQAGDQVGIGYGIFLSPFRMFLLSSFVLASPPPPASPLPTLIQLELALFLFLLMSHPLLHFQSPICCLQSPHCLFLAYNTALLVTGRTQVLQSTLFFTLLVLLSDHSKAPSQATTSPTAIATQ